MTYPPKDIDQNVNATTVAQLIGFDLVETFAELPVGFRLQWAAAEKASWFEDCETIGDLKRAYLRSLL